MDPMKPATESSNSSGASTVPPGQNPILEILRAKGIPLTRENYLQVAHPDAEEPYPAELELEVPEELRRGWSPPEE